LTARVARRSPDRSPLKAPCGVRSARSVRFPRVPRPSRRPSHPCDREISTRARRGEPPLAPTCTRTSSAGSVLVGPCQAPAEGFGLDGDQGGVVVEPDGQFPLGFGGLFAGGAVFGSLWSGGVGLWVLGGVQRAPFITGVSAVRTTRPYCPSSVGRCRQTTVSLDSADRPASARE